MKGKLRDEERGEERKGRRRRRRDKEQLPKSDT